MTVWKETERYDSVSEDDGRPILVCVFENGSGGRSFSIIDKMLIELAKEPSTVIEKENAALLAHLNNQEQEA